MRLTTDQMKRQSDFSATVNIVEGMYKRGLISYEDFKTAYGVLVNKYKPIIHLFVDYSKS